MNLSIPFEEIERHRYRPEATRKNEARGTRLVGDEPDARYFNCSWTSVNYDSAARLAGGLSIGNRSKWIRSFLRRRESRRSPDGVRTQAQPIGSAIPQIVL